jgi:hypothetical protein
MRRMAVRICKNGHEVTDDGLFYCPLCKSAELRPSGEAEAPAAPVPRRVPPPRPTTAPVPDVATADAATKRRWKRDDALARLRKVGVWGVGGYVVGAIIWVVSASSFGDVESQSDGGAGLGLLVGGLMASAGAAMVLVFLIGWGVKLGREAADV